MLDPIHRAPGLADGDDRVCPAVTISFSTAAA